MADDPEVLRCQHCEMGQEQEHRKSAHGYRIYVLCARCLHLFLTMVGREVARPQRVYTINDNDRKFLKSIRVQAE